MPIILEAQAIDDAPPSGPLQKPGPVELPAILDLKAALPLAAALLDRRGADLVLDASQVQRLGGQCLQVLLAAAVSWTADAHRMTIENPSADFLAALAGFGVPPGFILCHERPAA